MNEQFNTSKKMDNQDVIKVVLNSKNSQAVRELMNKLSAQLMDKNKKLYERLAYK